jgi:hypothetical protein
MQGVHFPVDHEDIELRAYRIWEKKGRPQGSETMDWFEAKRELTDELVARLEGKELGLRLGTDGRPVYGLVPLRGNANPRLRCGLVELSGDAASGNGKKRRYGLVELESEHDVDGHARPRYGLVELDGSHATDKLRYGLVELRP